MSRTNTQPRLRPATDADRDLLFQVYASTRAEEVAVIPWDAATKHAFLAQQFDAQDRYYREHYGDASFDVIEVGGEPAGRLYVHRGAREIRVVDVALLPAFRGRGAGTGILSEILDEARAEGKSVSIHVERENPARSLYDRLGFQPVGEHGIYLLMEWSPEGAAGAS